MDWERIKQRMTDLGLSQAELARRAGMTQGAIQQIVSGATLRSRKLPEIAVALGVSVPYLLGDTDEPDADFFEPKQSAYDVLTANGVEKIAEIDFGEEVAHDMSIVELRQAVFDKTWLASLTDSPAIVCFVARNIGDGMAPTLLDSDTPLFDGGHMTLKQQDRVWALTYGGAGMIRRVRKLPDQRYLVMSDNPSIPAFEAASDQVGLLGRLIWVGRKF